MPEIITVFQDLGIIQIESFGVLSAKDLLKSRQSVSEICQERGFTKILVDATKITSFPSTLQLFEHSVDLAELDMPENTKYAIVISEKTKADSKFIETAAINRNVKMRNFESRDQALAWLAE